MMKMRKLGNSGLLVSEIGLGCNNFGGRLDLEETRAVVEAAIDSGINFFDTADSYGHRGGSEKFLGEILGERRKDIVLATKFASPMKEGVTRRNASRAYIMQAVEDSLRRLKTDWIDVYYLHWPDPLTPMEETLRALDDLVRSGKVRYIAACNLSAWQMVEAEWLAKELGSSRFVCAQNEMSLLDRRAEAELLPALKAYELGLVPYFPLASGFLTGKYTRGKDVPAGSRFDDWKGLGDVYMTPRNWEILEKLQRWTDEHDRTLLEVAFGWLLAHDVVSSVIAGASKPEHIIQNAKAGERPLSEEELKSLNELLA